MKKSKSDGKQGKKKEVCFVLMPFDASFNYQWETAIEPAIEEVGLSAERADEHLIRGRVVGGITKSIYAAKLIMADVTNGNANVMYELGLAHAIEKPVIIVVQHDSEIPRDIEGLGQLRYDLNNLPKFKEELKSAIADTLAAGVVPKEDRVFPELEIMDDEIKEEFFYLKERTKKIEINTYPPTADIFFNDKLLGQAPQTAMVNPQALINTVSASCCLYLEEHRVLTKEEIEDGHVNIELVGMSGMKDDAEARKAHEYIRLRYKYVKNPAIMRALSHYFLYAGAIQEAREEAIELVKAVPDWYLAHNQSGHIATRGENADEGLQCFEMVQVLRPDQSIAYYNQACVYSLQGKFEKCVESIEKIFDERSRLESYCYLPFNIIVQDCDFSNIRKDPDYKNRFMSLQRKLGKKWKDFETKRKKALQKVRKQSSRGGRKHKR